MKNIFIRMFMPVRFKRFYARYKNQEFSLLDIGSDGSVNPTRKYFKKVKYYGLDHLRNESEIRLMDGFFHIDLSQQDLSVVPEDFFDVVVMSHVIEHLRNGLDVLSQVPKKLKSGGVIYIEFPSVDSLSFFNAKDVLNFCDEKTHARVYNLQEVANILLGEDMKIIRAGKRRDLARIILTPILMVRDFIRKRTFGASLWDMLGFADYVYAVKL